MMSPRVLICGLLCLSPVWSCADAEKSKTPASETPVEIKQPDKYKAVRDANDLRTIEIVTDRDETVAQFFARQQLSLVDNANTDGKFWSIGQIANGEANKIFVSYPLQNDQGFRLYRYGDFYQLEKPSSAVADLFADTKLNWKNALLVLAPDRASDENELNKKARLVGRVLIKNGATWRPEMDAESLKYQQPDAQKAD